MKKKILSVVMACMMAVSCCSGVMAMAAYNAEEPEQMILTSDPGIMPVTSETPVEKESISLIVDFTEIGMSSKVLVGRKWRTELDGMGCCHVTFDTLRGRSTREDAHLERSARLVLSHGSLGEFAEGCLRHAVWCETTQSDCILIVNHRCRFGSTQSCICHFLLT